MFIRLFIVSLLCALAFAGGVQVLGTKVQTKEVFACLRQTYPDFVWIALVDMKNWENFPQIHQNALDAGYKHVHVSISTWQSLPAGGLPKNFSGRIWISSLAWLHEYSQLVTMVENIVSQGYNVGFVGTPTAAQGLKGFVPNAISSSPYALQFSKFPWNPIAGWQCPSIILGAPLFQCERELVTPLNINPTCI